MGKGCRGPWVTFPGSQEGPPSFPLLPLGPVSCPEAHTAVDTPLRAGTHLSLGSGLSPRATFYQEHQRKPVSQLHLLRPLLPCLQGPGPWTRDARWEERTSFLMPGVGIPPSPGSLLGITQSFCGRGWLNFPDPWEVLPHFRRLPV